MTDSHENRQIADGATNGEEQSSGRATLADADPVPASVPPHQPVVDAFTDAPQIAGEQPESAGGQPLNDDDEPVVTSA